MSPTFVLHPGEPLGVGLPRVVLEQIQHAMRLRETADLDPAVHELRKAMKRTRAVLRLVRGELGDWRYRQENTCLRDTARLWGPTRDAAVLATLAADLTPQTGLDPAVADHLVATLRESAAATTRAAALDRRRHLDTLTTLGSFACRVRRFPTTGHGSFPDDFASVGPGMTRVALRAGRRMRRAESDPTTERLHRWRKDVKYLRFQVELLASGSPELLEVVAGGLDDLGTVLGDEHDLAGWAEAVRADHSLVPEREERDRLLGWIAHRRAELQGQAFPLGHLLLRDPDDLVRQVGAAWEHARHGA